MTGSRGSHRRTVPRQRADGKVTDAAGYDTVPQVQAAGPLVVGVDGSRSATEAVRWAAAEARLRGLTVSLVAVPRWPARRHEPAPGTLLDGSAPVYLAAAAAVAGEVAPGIVVTRTVAHGRVAGVLREAGWEASMLVLGSHRRGPVTGTLLGSVGMTVMAGARCPVVVVAEPDPWTAPAAPGDPVVVGVGAGAAAAARFAFDEAQRRGAPVHAVHATRAVHPGTRAAVDRLLEECRRLHPTVEVVARVLRESPAAALTRLSATAQLVVVGARPGARPPGGSVHRAVVRHGRCPVVVVAQQRREQCCDPSGR